MSISSVGSSAADYSTPAAPATGSNDAASAAPDPAASQPPAAPAPSPSTTVTLSDGTVSNVVLYTGKMTSMPMSVAAAPQLFFAADKDHDGKLSLGEFTDQMKRAGMTSGEAKQLYQQFNKSKGKELSIDDYVDGVVATNTSGSSAFQDVYLSYTSGKDGKYDMAVDNAFMAQGASTAAAYWAKHPELQRRS